MALDSYDDLLSEVQDWLVRADLAAKVPTFVRLLESQVERKLRVREMVTSTNGVISSDGTITLPIDFRGMKEIYISTSRGPKQLEYAPYSELLLVRTQDRDAANEPRMYSIVGTTVHVAPLPAENQAYTLLYYQRITGLSASNQSNWLLARHPDLYLYGTLMQAEPYLQGDERIQVWGSAMSSILEDIRVTDDAELRGSSPLRQRFTPYGTMRR